MTINSNKSIKTTKNDTNLAESAVSEIKTASKSKSNVHIEHKNVKLDANLKFEDLKLNSDDMIPVIVQDYKNDEVLMLAYMNKEAYEHTLETGRMTYYSRSRNELWEKGLTSGHFQYVKALYADCDKDTILAKVEQVGAACHTGKRSCFFREIYDVR